MEDELLECGQMPLIIGGYKMTIQDNTIIQPIPTDEIISRKREKMEIGFASGLQKFCVNYNGGIPNEKSFECN